MNKTAEWWRRLGHAELNGMERYATPEILIAAREDILELWERVQELEKKLAVYGDSPQGAL